MQKVFQETEDKQFCLSRISLIKLVSSVSAENILTWLLFILIVLILVYFFRAEFFIFTKVP